MGTPSDQAEGWYHDPYSKHEARWFSDGAPTDLVRDGTQVAHDPPPDESPAKPLIPVEDVGSGLDPRRADNSDAERSERHYLRSALAVQLPDPFLPPTEQ